MPRLENNGGDVLARGGVRATFKPAGSHLSDEEWNKIWGDFDPEAFKNAPAPTDPNAIKANSHGGFAEPEDAEQNSGDASNEGGSVGSLAGETVAS